METRQGKLDFNSRENLRKHIAKVKQRHRLPSPPGVITKLIHTLKDPDCNGREVARLIADDPALATRTIAHSRSAQYAQRRQPQTVQEAVLVLGLQTVRNIVLAIAAQSFLARKNKISIKLWAHSLAAALTARALAKEHRLCDPETAYLAGLLHDLGHMILFDGDPRGYEQIVDELAVSGEALHDKELEVYGFDHASVAFALLDHWGIDEQVNEAVIAHHHVSENRAATLGSIIDVADYVCAKAELGFFGEVECPGADTLAKFHCDSDDSLAEVVAATRSAFDQEVALFREL